MKRFVAVTAVSLGLLVGSGPAWASPIRYHADLSGANEAPPNPSPGTGTADVFVDKITHFLEVMVSFSGLTGKTTVAHIHAATAVPGVGNAGVATELPSFVGFPLGVSSGSYDKIFDTSLSSFYNPAFVTSHGGTVATAETAFIAALDNGTAYLNIHSSYRGGGEIRGFLQPVPEPGSVAFVVVGILGLAALRRRAG